MKTMEFNENFSSTPCQALLNHTEILWTIIQKDTIKNNLGTCKSEISKNTTGIDNVQLNCICFSESFVDGITVAQPIKVEFKTDGVVPKKSMGML